MPCAEAAVDSAEAKVLPHDAAEQEQDDQAAGESLNKASLMTAISAVLKGGCENVQSENMKREDPCFLVAILRNAHDYTT